jgi:hypothetical protein
MRERPDSGQQADGLQRHDHEGSGHQAPESGEHRRHHHEFKAAALDLPPAQGVAHDDEGRRENQKWNRRERLRRRALLQQAETCRPLQQRLIAAGESARHRKSEAERQQGIQRIRRHGRSFAKQSNDRPRFAKCAAARHQILKERLTARPEPPQPLARRAAKVAKSCRSRKTGAYSGLIRVIPPKESCKSPPAMTLIS